ncbi:MAG TPA: SDR family NAD(P)-dependent oxidoreductase, partial [Acidimicrobiales bacterium]|nr:SDR family NAD(P)-dependent oxidoreductase [Acidimicrobiales bacterium]
MTAPTGSGSGSAPARDADVPEPQRYATYPSLRGRGVVVTGGATGIGASLVAHFCAQGARVAYLDVAEQAGEELAATIEARGLARPRPYRCDVRDVAALQRAVALAGEEVGPLRVLVNNAADDTRRASSSVGTKEWDDSLAVNLRPHFFAA